MAKELLIDRLSDVELSIATFGFREDKLTTADLDCIRNIYGLYSRSSVVRIECDEAHQHGYKCLKFDNRHSAVVERLLQEIERYRKYIKDSAENDRQALGK